MRLFWENPYLKEFETVITDISPAGLVLEKTAFYAESGGQISDKGTINELPVLDVRYSKSGKSIYHKVDFDLLQKYKLRKKSVVNCKLDWEYRYATMKHHTLLHIVFLSFEKLYGHHKIIGSNVKNIKARVDFDFHDEIDINLLHNEINNILQSNIPIKVYPDKEKADYRYWELEGYPKIPCGGTHVKNTQEIGSIDLKLKSLGSQGTRIYCSVI